MNAALLVGALATLLAACLGYLVGASRRRSAEALWEELRAGAEGGPWP